MGGYFSKLEKSPSKGVSDVPKILINDTPIENAAESFKTGEKLIKPDPDHRGKWIQCDGTYEEMSAESGKMIATFNLLQSCYNCIPLLKNYLCEDLISFTFSLANMWKTYFVRNGWGENGTNGEAEIVEIGYGRLFMIRGEIENMQQNKLQDFQRRELVLKTWIYEVSDAIQLLKLRIDV
ncbi:hypothetical protein GCK72_024419 [Caenorhabditis remanei]|uniref:Uncharacterized protein n=1 Tax=Caenorhabditis remanei TaxID=31234 RepID=A0A6A5FZG8_CAERE|nr:hypothetical protein GCK72_024419 [Caenorhabditis remanei]KAF1747953.1 hypothetical protein GCK72_024419 [Caenorhabditis remanei]